MYIMISLGNFLNKIWQDEIWLPPLYFSNTKDNVRILNGDPITVKVLRQGEPIQKDALELYEGNTFSGKENYLQLYAKHECTFRCSFELSNFPFDNQRCTMNITIPPDLRNFTTLKPKELIYSGMYRF